MAEGHVVKVRRIVIRMSDIEHFTPEEKLLLAKSMFALNELNILATCVVVSAPAVHPPRNVRDSARFALTQFFYQLLAGKLVETWDAMRCDRALGARRGALSDRARTGRDQLAKYFDGPKSTLRLLRKKLAFHLDHEAIETALGAFARDDTFEMWMPSTHAGEARFELGAKITAAFLNAEVAPKEGMNGYDRFTQETLQAWRWMVDLLYGALDLLIHDSLTLTVSDEELPDETEPTFPVLGRVHGADPLSPGPTDDVPSFPPADLTSRPPV